MSIQAVAWVLEQYIPLPGPKLVLVALANHVGHVSGTCFPRVELIAQEASLSIRSVQRHLGWLEKNGFIKIERRFAQGRQTSNIYTLLMPRKLGGANVTPSANQSAGIVTHAGDTGDTASNRQINHQVPPTPRNATDHENLRSGISRGKRTPSEFAAASQRPKQRMLDRGRLELTLADLLGGWDILGKLPNSEINDLCSSLKQGTLGSAAVAAVRLKYGLVEP